MATIRLIALALSAVIFSGIPYSYGFLYENIHEWGSFGISDPGLLSHPQFVDVDGLGNVYVSDYGNKRIQKFDAGGKFVLEWGSSGRGDGQFHHPTGIASDDSFVYVVDRDLNRVQKFDLEGNFVSKWGDRGRADGMLLLPNGIAAHNGSVYVVDTGNYRVQKFTADGEFVLSFGSSGTGPGEFLTPHGIHVNGNGTIYVADKGNHKIGVFDLDGNHLRLLSFIGHDNFMPGGVHVDDVGGGLYVADANHGMLYRFESESDSAILPSDYSITLSSSARYADVAMSPDGMLYAVDSFNHAIHVYTTPSYAVPQDDVTELPADTDENTTDVIRPVLTPPPDIVVDADDPHTRISVGQAVATDEGGIYIILSNAPEKFPLGVTKITWMAFDNAMNMSEAYQYITVLTCGESHSEFNMIRGTAIDDILIGTEGRDLIFGLDGDDHINGASGNDCIFGGDGLDIIFGGSGDDTIYGSAGDDIIKGGPGSDTIDGGEGGDIIAGGSGADNCHARVGSNDLLASCES